MKKLYIVGPYNGAEGVYNLIADDGEHLASHFCSHAGYAEGDLYSNRDERKKLWTERFGEYQVIWLGRDEMTQNELISRNKAWFENSKENEEKQNNNQPSATIEIEVDSG